MAAVAQDLSDQPDNETEWSWDAMKNWWNPAGNKGCKKAETNLIKHFIDKEIYTHASRQISINYDPQPISVKKQKLKRSQSLSLFSWRTGTDSTNSNINNSITETSSISAATMSTSAITTQSHYKQLKNNNTQISPKKEKNYAYQQYIHTLSFGVKSNKLKCFSNTDLKQNDEIDMDNDIDEEFSDHATVNQQDLSKDGDAIEGTSMTQFMKRTKGQAGSSSYDILHKQLCDINKKKPKPLHSIAPIVLTHGYGCAGGMFIPAIPDIYNGLLCHICMIESPVIHVIDWLGNGMSSRPVFECQNTVESEDWFVDSLEQWRKAMNIEKMILSGHSLGGYLCAVYAMKYPQYIEHLILLSPVGVPIRPKQSQQQLKNYSWKVRTMMKTFGKLWNSGWTPHDIIRITGPKGKSVIDKVVQKRLFRLNDNDPLKTLLAEYLYQVIAQHGSAEYALNKILAPGAWAYKPLVNRIGTLKQYQRNVKGYNYENEKEKENEEKEEKKENDSMKIDFIYGETDWMTSAHAVKLKQEGVIKCNVYINPDCGHQLTLENAHGFGQLLGAIIAKGQILSSS